MAKYKICEYTYGEGDGFIDEINKKLEEGYKIVNAGHGDKGTAITLTKGELVWSVYFGEDAYEYGDVVYR